jgi:hypothetical protein
MFESDCNTIEYLTSPRSTTHYCAPDGNLNRRPSRVRRICGRLRPNVKLSLIFRTQPRPPKLPETLLLKNVNCLLVSQFGQLSFTFSIDTHESGYVAVTTVDIRRDLFILLLNLFVISNVFLLLLI